eukprot:scaffold7.g3387.t1
MAAAQIVLLALLALAGVVAADWEVVTTLKPPPPGVRVQLVGPPTQPFARPLPRTLDPHLLSDFEAPLNVLQDLSLTGDNAFYVATIPGGMVSGEGGSIFDSAGRAYLLPYLHSNRSGGAPPLPPRGPAEAAAGCERHARLASVIQRFGHMYYHFLEEALPRVAALRAAGALTPETKLLAWGYLGLLGIPRSQVVAYDPLKTYCADELLVPAPTPRIEPPREALLAARAALDVHTLPAEQRDLIVYASREGQASRRVANEAALLAAVRGAFPGLRLAVHRGDLPAADAIELFQRAKVIIGPHGAGLSHALFAAPGTTLVEFLFLADPPLMFWCEACAPGTYASNAGSPQCRPCPPGRFAPELGSAACRTALPGSYAPPGGAAVLPCPTGTHAPLPGAWSADQCLSAQQRRQAMEAQAADPALLSKLSPIFARVLAQRRALVQQAALAAGAGAAAATAALPAPTAQDLCVAQQLAGGVEAYAGPYRLASLDCPPPPTTDPVPAPAPAPSPGRPPALRGGATPAEPLVSAFSGPPDSQLPPVAVPTLPPGFGTLPAVQQPAEALGSPPAQASPILDTFVIAILGALAGLARQARPLLQRSLPVRRLGEAPATIYEEGEEEEGEEEGAYGGAGNKLGAAGGDTPAEAAIRQSFL